MKILYVYNFEYPDYQSDTIYHGLIDNNYDVYETHYPSYMLKSFESKTTIYGKGFTLFGKLEHTPKVDSPEIIVEKIRSRFYDIIIYGCVYTHEGFPKRQCLDYFEYVKQHYPKDKVHFIDGSDYPWNFAHAHGLNPYGIIWKTHLVDPGAANPITFGIPESQLIDHTPNKQKIFANIIPGRPETYIYDNEKDYYQDYATSFYGMTWKKAQWNCMRHYEILANKCIPYFPDIDECPPLTMVNFPKDVIRETNKYARRYEVHPDYNKLNEYLFDYTKNNLTTKKISKTILM